MRKHIRIALLLFALPVAVTLVLVMRQPTVPLGECSELYRRYADSQDIRAAYIKDYRVNDSLTINATILEATTDSSWLALRITFHDTIIDAYTETLKRGHDFLTLLTGARRPDGIMSNDEFAVLSQRDRYICVFHIQDSIQREKVLDGIIDRIFFSINNNNNFKTNEKSN